MLTRIVPPTVEPISLQEAKAHLRVDIDEDDDLIYGLVVACRECIEGWTSRSLLVSTWRLTLDHFAFGRFGRTGQYLTESIWPGTLEPILIPRAELIAVSQVHYVDPAGASVLLDPVAYQVETGAPGRLVPTYGRTWPPGRIQPGAVTVEFTAGYGSTPAEVPHFVKAALKLLLAHFYENREATVTSSIGLREAPLGVQALVALACWGDY